MWGWYGRFTDWVSEKRFLFSSIVFSSALGPDQSSDQWIQGTLSMWVNEPGREADQTPHIMPRLMRGASPPLPHVSSCRNMDI
jgi:hypothetical protein